MDNSKRTFGVRLKQLRKIRGFKQDSLAAELNIASATVKNWEQGRTWPEMPDLLRLCSLLDCDADYLLGGIELETHDLQTVCEYTGLSAEAVKKLHSVYFDRQTKALISRLILEYGGKYHSIYEYAAAAIDSQTIANKAPDDAKSETWLQNRMKAAGVITKKASQSRGTVDFSAQQAVDFNLSEAARVFREFTKEFVSETADRED